MKTLITGGTGFLGSELSRILLDKGDEVVLFDVAPRLTRLGDIKDSVAIVSGNIANASELYNVVKDSRPDRIFHLASMVSIASNLNPWASFQVNVVGTLNALEAARLFDVPQVVFTSTIATFGLDSGRVAGDTTVQHPTTMYGCGKVYCENLGRFYRTKFGLDFRAIRYPSVIGPGSKEPHVSVYNAWMIEYALRGKPFECFVTGDTKMPIAYFKDAARAVDAIAAAPIERIKTVNYNVAGITPTISAKDIEMVVKRHVPDAQISYVPDPAVMEFYKTFKIDTFDDSRAREEWGWCPQYPDIESVLLDFKAELSDHPDRYA